MLMQNLNNITHVAVGKNHIIALSDDGSLYSWGNPEHFQLGRHVIVERNVLVPTISGATPLTYISAGTSTSFAMDKRGRVWPWGLNAFGQCGISPPRDVVTPTLVEYLVEYVIVQITGGDFHTAAVTETGELLMWASLDCLGLADPAMIDVAGDLIRNTAGDIRGLVCPTIIGHDRFSHIGCGSSHSIAVDIYGKAWAWGFGDSYQTGQGLPPGPGDTYDRRPQRSDNPSMRKKHFVRGGGGGQFSVLAAL